MVETLETRVLLSGIVINSTDGGQNYAATVTVGQLDPTHTAVTLRDAVNAANNTTGADTISFDLNVFPPNAFTTITLSGGMPLELKDTSGATTIAGPGAGQVAVAGNSLSTVFLVDAGVTAAIDGLTISGGQASIDFGGVKVGGGLYNAGTLALLNDVVTSNSAAGYGGGFFNSGTVTVTASTLSNNSAQFGGGFFNTGTVTVTGSTLTANSVTTNGGGFYNQATATVTDSTLSANSAGSWGGGFFSNNTVTVSGSTLANNSAGVYGGGFFNSFNAAITESTIANNSAQYGGGIMNFSSVTVNESTIAGNSVQFAGGGIYNVGSNVTLAGTILARNTIAQGATSSDWFGSAANAASSYNLIGDGTNTGLANGTNQNIVGNAASPLDPHLAPLANNGGPTQTMALLAGSPAINAGSNALVASLTTDQRGAGFSRIAGIVVDIGAFEIQSHPPGAPAVNTLVIDTNKPVLTGTWDEKNAIVLQVTVNTTTFTRGVDPQLTSDGSGHWTLTTSAAIPDGTYDVAVHTANEIGEVTNATATNALVIDTVPPATPTVTSLVTNNNQPVLTGTWDQGTPGGATLLQVTVNGTTFTLGTNSQLTSDGSGHWTLAISATIPDGTYNVLVHTADAAGNISDVTAMKALIVDTLPPATPTVTSLVTNNNQPVLTGTWDQGTPGGATVLQVTVNGTTFTLGTNPQLTSDSSGHWTLTESATIPDGTYDVLVHTADAAGNVSNVLAAKALIVDTVPPATPTVTSLVTNNNQPVLTGTWGQGTLGGATVLQVTVNGTTFTLGTNLQLTSDGSGHWTLTTSATIPDGMYDVSVHTADAAGNISDVTAMKALIVDTVPPATPTVTSLVTNNNQPVLTGTWDQGTPGGATVLQVTIDGTTFTLEINPQLTSDGSGHWTLTASATIPDGTYDVLVHTADAAGNVSNVVAANALIVYTTPATPTVNSLTTTNPAPTLTGTWDSTHATLLSVTISNTAKSYSATYTLGSSPQLVASGGSWTLNLAGATLLSVGTYNVSVHTANAYGKTADSTSGLLVINSTPPVVGALSSQSASVGVPVNISAAITGGDTTGLTASIQWGDGTTTSATIATSGSALTVTGSHIYSTAGKFNIQLTVTNAAGLSTPVATTATITAVSSASDLKVTSGPNVQILAANATANYDFEVTFVSGGLQLTGAPGTTFNGASTLFIANAKSISGQLGNGDDQVRITGTGTAVTLAMGGGQNDVTFQNFIGGKVQVSADGALNMHALNSTMSNLMVTGGASADLFQAFKLVVTVETQLSLGGGANAVQIDDSHFKNFKLQSSGNGTSIRIEAGAADGTSTQFDGAVVFQLDGSAQLYFSPLSTSDQTVFGGNLNINAGSPNARWHRQNVTFAHGPTLKNVDIA